LVESYDITKNLFLDLYLFTFLATFLAQERNAVGTRTIKFYNL
jgi:hypothetical protein